MVAICLSTILSSTSLLPPCWSMVLSQIEGSVWRRADSATGLMIFSRSPPSPPPFSPFDSPSTSREAPRASHSFAILRPHASLRPDLDQKHSQASLSVAAIHPHCSPLLGTSSPSAYNDFGFCSPFLDRPRSPCSFSHKTRIDSIALCNLETCHSGRRC